MRQFEIREDNPVHLTDKYRLLTMARYQERLNTLVESQRQLYNAALQERIDCYKKTGVSLSCFDQYKGLTACRKAIPEMAALPLKLQRGTVKRLDAAFQAFFRRVKAGQNPGFPRFRGKGWYDTLEWAEFQGITLKGNHLKSKAFGTLRVHFHRPLPDAAELKSCKIVRDVKGWSVCFVVQVDTPEKCTIQTSVGLDMGLTDLVTLSTGEKIPTLRAARRAARKLRIARRHLARCQRGSKGRQKARQRVARCHLKVKHQRRTYAHQMSKRLVDRFDLIAVEDLNVKGLARLRSGKSVLDASWSTLTDMLAYKAERAGTHLIRVDPNYTSQDCSRCGERVPKPLAQRVHHCPKCGLVLDRDENAAVNILHRAVVSPGGENVSGYAERCPGKLRLQEISI